MNKTRRNAARKRRTARRRCGEDLISWYERQMRDPVFRGIVDCLATQSIDEIPDLPTFPDFEIDPFL